MRIELNNFVASFIKLTHTLFVSGFFIQSGFPILCTTCFPSEYCEKFLIDDDRKKKRRIIVSEIDWMLRVLMEDRI